MADYTGASYRAGYQGFLTIAPESQLLLPSQNTLAAAPAGVSTGYFAYTDTPNISVSEGIQGIEAAGPLPRCRALRRAAHRRLLVEHHALGGSVYQRQSPLHRIRPAFQRTDRTDLQMSAGVCGRRGRHRRVQSGRSLHGRDARRHDQHD